MSQPHDLPQQLEAFRPYLRVLARTQLAGPLQQRLDASDIVQQTMLHAHQARATFRGASERELAGWLRQILARNLAQAMRDHHREKRDVRREQSLEADLLTSSLRLADLLGADQTGVEERAVRGETLLRLAAALEQMPDDQREAVELHYLRELPVSQVAAAMGRSVASVGGLLHRGLKRLRGLLGRDASSTSHASDASDSSEPAP